MSVTPTHPVPFIATATYTQQVSYHRDHVYLFDATGATRSSAAVSDPALSSFFIPAPPQPPPPRPQSTTAMPELASISSTTTGGDGGDGQGSGSSGGAPRSRCGEEELDASGDTAVRVLEAHRALAAWDGRGGKGICVFQLPFVVAGVFLRR